MQGHARISTFPHIGMDPATKPMLERMTGPDGKPVVCDRVWISALGCGGPDEAEKSGPLTAGFGAGEDKIGPEFTFGLHIAEPGGPPVLIIKTAWGGKSLNTDFRPPSAGPYVFRPEQLERHQQQGRDVVAVKAEKAAATGAYYRLMIRHVKAVLADIKRVVPAYDESQGYELAGFAWVQGWNDMVDGDTYPERDKPGGYDAYSSTLAHFIRDIRRDLEAPGLPFVIGVLGVGGPTRDYGPGEQRYAAVHQHFRDAMAAPASLPEFRGNVAAVLMENSWDQELSKANAKDQSLRQEAKKQAADTKLDRSAEEALYRKLRAEKLTERERRIVDTGVSNFEFHYLGSSKILGSVGRDLAAAMGRLKQP
jgi:alpha-galactosidase